MTTHQCTEPDCWLGSHTREQRNAEIRRHIERVGWIVIGVLGTPSIAYTIGMTERRWPELLFTLDVDGTAYTLGRAQHLLNAVGKQLVDAGERPYHGQVVDLTDSEGGVWKCLLERRLDTTPLTQAKNYYRRSVSAMEVDFVACPGVDEE